MILRSGIPTASEFDALITPLGKVRTGDGPWTYVHRKLAEKWQGGPLPAWSGSGMMEQGQILEKEARPTYALIHEVKIDRVGFITSDDGRFGCSPDGLIPGAGLEIKCPDAHTQVGYLLDGGLPDEYRAQVQGSLLISELDEWRFFAYRRNFPNVDLVIHRDEAFISNLRDALEVFWERFQQGFEKMVEINGAPPKHQMTPYEVRQKFVTTDNTEHVQREFVSSMPS